MFETENWSKYYQSYFEEILMANLFYTYLLGLKKGIQITIHQSQTVVLDKHQ